MLKDDVLLGFVLGVLTTTLVLGIPIMHAYLDKVYQLTKRTKQYIKLRCHCAPIDKEVDKK